MVDDSGTDFDQFHGSEGGLESIELATGILPIINARVAVEVRANSADRLSCHASPHLTTARRAQLAAAPARQPATANATQPTISVRPPIGSTIASFKSANTMP